jgi:predicted lipid-binding transport protein (Tim44 family)
LDSGGRSAYISDGPGAANRRDRAPLQPIPPPFARRERKVTDDAMIELIILAALAVFVLMRLKSVLGTRTGFERPTGPAAEPAPESPRRSREFEVIEGGAEAEEDIARVADSDSDLAAALRRMAAAEPGFSPSKFLEGAKRAYETILMAYEAGDLKALRPLLEDDVYESFAAAVRERERDGLTVEARFIGIREAKIFSAIFTEETGEADIEVRFVAELMTVVRNVDHEIVEGDPNEVRRQTDLWTFSRRMGSSDPNWRLSATGG